MAQTGLGYGETGADGRYTLLPVCCLGNCDKGPTLMIDDDTHGRWPPPMCRRCWSATHEPRPRDTHPLTWRLDHGAPVLGIDAYEALDGYAAVRKVLGAWSPRR